MHDIREGYADVNGLRMHYGAAGDAEAPMLVFLHGFPEYWGMWRELMQRLAPHFFCLAPDQIGYNLTSKPAEVSRYRTKAIVEDARVFAKVFAGTRRFTLVAHDWGGAVAWAFALKHPALLERLVIINAVHPAAFQREIARNPDQAAASQYINAMQAADADAAFAADDFARLRFSFRRLEEKGLLPPEELARYRAAWAQPGAITGMLNWYRAMKMRPPTETKAAEQGGYDPAALTVHVKTLVLWGLKDDALLPGCIEGLEQWVPDLTLKTFPEASHWLAHEEPAAIADAIAAFCGAHA